jgi:preprotein translocase subunit SecF
MKEGTQPVATTKSTAPSSQPTSAPQRFFELLPSQTNIDFVAKAPRMVLFSFLFIVIGLASIYLRGGLNYGTDFAGGTVLQVRFPAATPIADVRAALDRPELGDVVVQEVGRDGREFHIRVQEATEAGATGASETTRNALREKFGEGAYDVLRVESVGPKVGRDLWRDATLAVLASTVMMGLYIALRFDIRFGVGTAGALIHDVLFALAAISLANMEFDLTTVAALLTIVGFSVNDNVVISDRIRENLRKVRRGDLATTLNVALNETLSRTVINSGTVIFVSTALFLLGGSVIHSFAFTLLVGFVIGTYSSIFVSTPIVLFVDRRLGRRS